MVMGSHLNNYVETELGGKLYKDRTKGFGDTAIAAIHPIALSANLITIYDIGVSLPTGSINMKNQNAPQRNYAYNMQLGSGTYDALLGATALYIQPVYQIGGRGSATLRTGENSNEYRLGNLYRADAWIDAPVGYGLTPRLVGYYKWKDAINGMDKSIGRNPYTEFYHHAQINWDVSAALKYTNSLGTKSVALNAEVGAPIAQGSRNVDNVTVSTDYYANLGLTGTF